MVDFNNEATITTPSYDLLKILAIEKRENLNLAWGHYWKHKKDGYENQQDLEIISSRTLELWLELRAWYNSIDSAGQDIIMDSIKAGKEAGLFMAFQALDNFMFSNNLTKINSKKVYNKNRVEVENELREL